ncbi:protein LBH [Silurus asotus]|uniref:Protein LBH n=1 Tax=Silurus asotus TaxID=30991 RepID=A0AAD5A8J3_SILAS|nr:protein LBH [Silurus asotus]
MLTAKTYSRSRWETMRGMRSLRVLSSVFVPCREMTEVMISSTPMEDIRLSPSKDRLTFQIFPDPSDFERCCKLKDRLPSIVVEATEGEVESGELRWPPEEILNNQDEEEDEDDDEEEEIVGNVQQGQQMQTKD